MIDRQKEEGDRTSWSLCSKPIVNLFQGEKFNKKYRQLLSDHSNQERFGSFSNLMAHSIELLEEYIPERLDLKPDDQS